MQKLQWIKLSTELFGSPEIRILLALPGGQTAVLVYLFLLTAAGRLNDGGRAGISETLPYSERFLAIQLGVSPEEVRAALEQLAELELIDEDGGGFWRIRGWETQQTVEKDALAREKNRLRKARYRSERAGDTASDEPVDINETDENERRDKHRMSASPDSFADPLFSASGYLETNNGIPNNAADDPNTGNRRLPAPVPTCPTAVPPCPTGTNGDCPASVPSCPAADKEEEKESEKEKKERKKKKTAVRFRPPTAEEVAVYCRGRGNQVDPRRFVDYYTANGWRIGKTPMSDWQAAVRTWERNGAGASPLSKIGKGCPPGAALGPTGIPILQNQPDELGGIL